MTNSFQTAAAWCVNEANEHEEAANAIETKDESEKPTMTESDCHRHIAEVYRRMAHRLRILEANHDRL